MALDVDGRQTSGASFSTVGLESCQPRPVVWLCIGTGSVPRPPVPNGTFWRAVCPMQLPRHRYFADILRTTLLAQLKPPVMLCVFVISCSVISFRLRF